MEERIRRVLIELGVTENPIVDGVYGEVKASLSKIYEHLDPTKLKEKLGRDVYVKTEDGKTQITVVTPLPSYPGLAIGSRPLS